MMNHAILRTDAFLNQRLAWVDRNTRTRAVKEYWQREQKNGYRSANIWLRKFTQPMLDKVAASTFTKPLTGDSRAIHSPKECEKLADAHARECFMRVREFESAAAYTEKVRAVYSALVSYTERQGVNPPYTGQTLTEALCESGILKMVCSDWWSRRLRRQREELAEFLQIAAGNVNRNRSAYISNTALGDYRQRQRKTADFLQSMEAVNEHGDSVNLYDTFMKSSANPENRRIELLVRASGLEELMQDMGGKSAVMLTITAPAKYHRSADKWRGATPKDAQQYLTNLWAKIRADLNREQIAFSGLRVAEPHHDATPHWHLLIFCDSAKKAALVETCRDWATRAEPQELKSTRAKRARFDVVEIDPRKGSAVGYMTKYITKNINGTGMAGADDIDLEAQTSAGEGAERVRAWARRWHIRQFQFFGVAPVTVYRELRRIESADNPHLEALRTAADGAKWIEFEKLMRQERAKLVYEENGVNRYNEPQQKIVGVAVIASAVKTRLMQWVLKKRGDSSATWIDVSNCNEGGIDEENAKRTLGRCIKTHRPSEKFSGARQRCANNHGKGNARAVSGHAKPLV